MIKSCDFYTGLLYKSSRKILSDKMIEKNTNELNVTYCIDDSFEKFEEELNISVGKSSIFYKLRKKFILNFISFITAIIILIALLSVSIYEDILKKIIFEMPFEWTLNDSISIFFALTFFIGLFLMPSLIEGESNEFKTLVFSWFNKDIRKDKKINVLLSSIDKKTTINLYNFDIAPKDSFLWSIVVKNILQNFENVNFYIRNENIQTLKKNLSKFDIQEINEKKINEKNQEKVINKILLSNDEKKLSSLLYLCSFSNIENINDKEYFSLELFEYYSKNILSTMDNNISFQSFVNSCFNDFYYLNQENSNQIFIINSNNIHFDKNDEKKISYYLKNNLEDCIETFDNPISLVVLYYFVKNIVVDDNRIIKLLNKLILTIENSQEYSLIKSCWFDIAGKFFDCDDIDNFDKTMKSYYRKIPINNLDILANLFIRNGFFDDAILIYNYLKQVNIDKYAIKTSSLYERIGNFKLALETLPTKLQNKSNSKPSDLKISYLQKKSWIIVSQRNDSLKEEGQELLNELREVLFGYEGEIEPLALWHYYNIKANYDEWNNDFDSAIKYYKKSLKVPVLGPYEYGATFINMSIAFRFLYINSNYKNKEYIDLSIKYGQIGLNLKLSSGERDEISVVVHNQALNILYKSFTEVNIEECNYVFNLTKDALTTLKEINSTKKLGMLLIENYISACLSNNDMMLSNQLFEDNIDKIDINELKQLLNVYKLFRNDNKITCVEILENTNIKGN